MSYENDLRIDEHKLNEEWIRQPFLYMRYAEKAALADSRAKRLKEGLEVLKAELSLSLREEHSQAGEKFTEAGIAAEILQQKKYQNTMTELNEASEEAALFQAAVRAFDHKKAALENLVKLKVAGFYSHPTAPEETKASIKSQEKRKEYNEKLRGRK